MQYPSLRCWVSSPLADTVAVLLAVALCTVAVLPNSASCTESLKTIDVDGQYMVHCCFWQNTICAVEQ